MKMTIKLLSCNKPSTKQKKWLASWQLQINVDKTLVFYVGKNNKKFHYQFYGMLPIKESEEIRDLGIYVDSQLNFRKHLGRIIRIAYFKARQLLRTLKSKSSQIWLNAYTNLMLGRALNMQLQFGTHTNKLKLIKLRKFRNSLLGNFIENVG